MKDVKAENLKYSEILRSILQLRTEPIAVKMIENEADIPADAVLPFRDWGSHMAICQAFAIVRREKTTIYCDKTSEWCWNPLVTFGLCESDEGTEAFEILIERLGISDRTAAARFFASFPRLPYGKYKGVLLSPLCSCGSEPDVTLVYCDNNSQLRGAALAIKNATGKIISTQLDAIDSCAYACVATMNSGEYRVTIPDIGEHERAFAGENEIILSVPKGRLGELTDALDSFDKAGRGYAYWKRCMAYDFPQPPFYQELYRVWDMQ